MYVSDEYSQDDWAVPADDDDNDEAQAMDAEDTPQAPPEEGSKQRKSDGVKGIILLLGYLFSLTQMMTESFFCVIRRGSVCVWFKSRLVPFHLFLKQCALEYGKYCLYLMACVRLSHRWSPVAAQACDVASVNAGD